MRGNLKWVVGLAAVVVASVLVGLAWEFFENSRKVSQAKSLLVAFGSLQVGKSTAEDVDAFVRHNGIESRSVQISGVCSSGAQTRGTVVHSHVLNWLGLKSDILRVFGNRVWDIWAVFVIDNGKLCYAEYSLRAFNKGDSIMVTSQSQIGDSSFAEHAFHVSVDLFKGIGRIRMQTDNSATEQERRRSLDFDLSCLSQIEGCRSSCEVVPWAWSEYQKEGKEYGWDVPIEEPAELRCGQR